MNSQNVARIAGIVLTILGVVALAYQGISYTSSETVADIGPLQVEKETRNTIPLPPILGAVALIGGVVLIISSLKK